MKKILAAFAGNTVFANIVLVMIFVAGWFATESGYILIGMGHGLHADNGKGYTGRIPARSVH